MDEITKELLDALKMATLQNQLDMLMTGEELRKCESAIAKAAHVPVVCHDHANELRRMARKVGHPAGDVPAVMRAAADRIDEMERLVAAFQRAEAED